jgi:hypothetical protein
LQQPAQTNFDKRISTKEEVRMTPGWAVVYTAAGQLQAQIIRSLLESAEIPVQTVQEGAGAVYAFTIGPMGEVDVMVPEDRLAEAQGLIAAYERGELE